MNDKTIRMLLAGLVVTIGVAAYGNYQRNPTKTSASGLSDTTGAGETPPGETSPGDTLEHVGSVLIVLDKTTYEPGAMAELLVANGSDGLVMFAVVCDALIEGAIDEEWITVFKPDCSRIRVRPTRLDGGESVKLEFRIPNVVQQLEGYRVRLRYQRTDGGDEVAYSTPFSITF